tara:strand:- start:14872 stop:15399 length:528 start_codon:yes stop_codon:yes gene_type:complete
MLCSIFTVAILVTVGSFVATLSTTPFGMEVDVDARLSELDQSVPEEVKAGDSDKIALSESMLDRKLQRPVVDPPALKKAVKPTAPTRATRPQPTVQSLTGVTLLGLFLAHNRSYALLETARGRVEVRRVGDHLEYATQSAKLVQIGPDSVTLENSGRRTKLELQTRPRLAAQDVK